MNLTKKITVVFISILCYSMSAQKLSEIPRINDNYVLPNEPDNSSSASTLNNRYEEKLVGLFYWTWHMEPFIEKDPIKVSDVLNEHPEAVNDYHHPAWEGKKGRHHWGESVFGYYLSTDKWVLRKHAEMLADADVDVVIFDTTNPPWLWDEAFDALGEVWTQARKDGIRAPDFAFLMPFTPHEESKEMIERLYNKVYKNKLYEDLWFYWKGKPLIMGYPDNVSDEIQSFFTFRPGQPSYATGPTRPDQWGWLEMYPQHGFVENEDGSFEQVTVGVAQNATDSLTPSAMNNTNQVFGRSYTQKHGLSKQIDAVNLGLNFQEQWDRALEMNPEFIFVTGWNEWTAGRYKNWQGTTNAFPDQFTQEYSRDIEPMKGGHQDNYYVQFVRNIKRYKGIEGGNIHTSPLVGEISIDGNFTDWKSEYQTFKDHSDYESPRKSMGYGSLTYQNESLVNDILISKVTSDKNNFYFYVQTKNEMDMNKAQSMMLLIDSDRNVKSGWSGYDIIINRKTMANDKAVLERHLQNFDWRKTTLLDIKVKENEMELKIPKAVLNLKEMEFDFKWWDNSKASIEYPTDFYVSGDTAPSECFNYLYRE